MDVQPPRRWRVSLLFQTLTFTVGTVRVLLRLGLLSGTELCRAELSSGWAPVYTTEMFSDEVAHTGDPAIKAHRRRAVRWLPVAAPLMLWMGLFGMLTLAELPALGEALALMLVLVAPPLTVWLAWTAWFARSLLTAVGGRRVIGEPATVAPRRLPAPELIEEELARVRAQVALEKELAALQL